MRLRPVPFFLCLFSSSLWALDCPFLPPQITQIAGMCSENSAPARALRLQELNNPRQFCDGQLRERFFNVHRQALAQRGITSADDPGFAAAAQNILDFAEEASDPWEYTLIPDPVARRRAYEMAVARFEQFHGAERPRPLGEGAVRAFLSRPRPRSDAQIAVAQENFALRRTGAQRQGSILEGFQKSAACLALVAHEYGDCMRGLERVEAAMLPTFAEETYEGETRRHAPIAGQAWWEEIYGSQDYEEGIRLAALRIQDRVLRPNARENATGDVQSDLREAFIQSGMPADRAGHAALRVLGVIATAGPNLGGRTWTIDNPASMRSVSSFGILSGEQSQLSLGLNLIASSMSHLDSLRSVRGAPLYSLPPEVNATCDNAKPYHFWMAAGIARDLTANGIHPSAAAAATYLAQVAYQLNRDEGRTDGRGDLENILTRDSWDPVMQVIRTDLAYAASGTVYGVSLAPRRDPRPLQRINLDGTLRSLVEAAPDLPGLSEGAAERRVRSWGGAGGYARWSEVIRPGVAYRSVVNGNMPLLQRQDQAPLPDWSAMAAGGGP